MQQNQPSSFQSLPDSQIGILYHRQTTTLFPAYRQRDWLRLDVPMTKLVSKQIMQIRQNVTLAVRILSQQAFT